MAYNFNLLDENWIPILRHDGQCERVGVRTALSEAAEIRQIAAASPLDLFAAHRFLLTLLYWKASFAGGVQEVRRALMRGEMPSKVLDAILAETRRFNLFDDTAPFLQDISLRDAKTKSAGYLFAEFACGTNIAHFHHGDDKRMGLCAPCATVGMLRLVPWSQSGGAGLSPSVHNAPPIMATACGENLAATLGLNLIPLSGAVGSAAWTGHFKPTDKNSPIPALEAFTWNPRRVHLRTPQHAEACWRCGQRGVPLVGPIVYSKNAETTSNKTGTKTTPFVWKDPSAFYRSDNPHTTIKSYNEELAARGEDLNSLFEVKDAPNSAVVQANPDHRGWRLVIPCTNPANNKTYDHRDLELPTITATSLRTALPPAAPATDLPGLDGWTVPRATSTIGATRFVQAAARLLTLGDWAALSAATCREMHDSALAFDVFSGLFWSLRGRKVPALPSRNAAWLVLKLMATVPARARVPHADAPFCPLRSLPRRELDERRGGHATPFRYPVSLPRGHRLEAALAGQLDRNLRKRQPENVDWAGLCHRLDLLLD